MRYCRIPTADDWLGISKRVGNDALGALWLAWVWSAREQSDGIIPKHVAEDIAPPMVWRVAIAGGLAVDRPGAYELIGFCAHHKTAEQLRELSAKRAESGSRGGRRRWAGRGAA